MVAIIIIIAVLAMFSWLSYNGLVGARNAREESFSNIDAMLKKRWDKIHEVFDAVKGYCSHEKEILEKVTAARTAAQGAKTINEKIAAENKMASALGSINAVVEAYPELKASTSFLHLQESISTMEDELGDMRLAFNAATREYNNKVQMFPSNIFASIFHFEAGDMFVLEDRKKYEETIKLEF